MVAAASTRRKGQVVHRYVWYRCSFPATKEPAVSAHDVGYRREQLEGALLAKFREAMTASQIDALATKVNDRIEAPFRRRDARVEAIKTKIL